MYQINKKIIKFISIIIIELIFGFYWILILNSFLFDKLPLIFYFIVFPVVYFVFGLFDVIKNNIYKYYFLSFLPIIGFLLFSFINDGLTTAVSNPDSSIFAWFTFFSFIRFVTFIISGIVIYIVYNIRKNK